MPFKSEQEFQSRFLLKYTSSIRISKLLELLDHNAVNVGYNYYYKEISTSKTTKFIDNIYFYNKMDTLEDLFTGGYPNYLKRRLNLSKNW